MDLRILKTSRVGSIINNLSFNHFSIVSYETNLTPKNDGTSNRTAKRLSIKEMNVCLYVLRRRTIPFCHLFSYFYSIYTEFDIYNGLFFLDLCSIKYLQ